jgi:hypothetical protein
MVDFHPANEILDQVEAAFSELIGKHGLRGLSIERWRWDEPGIMLMWSSPDNIDRNVHAVIDDDTPAPGLVVEANAWQDQDEEEGNRRVRYWKHENVIALEIPFRPHDLYSYVEQAFKAANSWTLRDLEKVDLTPWPTR